MTPIKLKYLIQTILLFSILIICYGCSDLDIDYQINGENANSGLDENGEITENDTARMLKIYVGDTVIFRNITEPESSIESTKWDIDGNGVADDRFNDIGSFKTVYIKPGVFKTKLWVNDAKDPITKWIRVEGDYALFTELVPEIQFVHPSTPYKETTQRRFQLEASLTELFESDSISLTINGTITPFEFDEDTGMLTQEVELSSGVNSIEIVAITEGDDNVYTQSTNIELVTAASEGLPKPKAVKVEKPKTQTIKPKEEPKPRPTQEPKQIIEDDPIFVVDEKPQDVPTEAPIKSVSIANVNLKGSALDCYPTSNVTSDCNTEKVENYSFTVTPNELIRINDFIVYSDVCGGLNIVIKSKEGELLNTTETLTQGRSQISFGFTTKEVYLKKDVSYTIELNPMRGNTNCASTTPPKLLDTKSCNSSPRNRPHLKTKLKGKAIIHDLNYSFKND